MSIIKVPPKIANLEQLAITGKEVSSLSFLSHHVAILEIKSPLHSANIKMIKVRVLWLSFAKIYCILIFML